MKLKIIIDIDDPVFHRGDRVLQAVLAEIAEQAMELEGAVEEQRIIPNGVDSVGHWLITEG